MILISGITFLYLFSHVKTLEVLEVGDRCGLENEGVCTLITNCRERITINVIKLILLLKEGKEPNVDSCRFHGQVEVVCCSGDRLRRQLPVRSSIAACEKYSKDYSIDLKPFIIEGKNVSLGQFPYMAAVGYPGNTDGEISWECGGTLISERFVLTTAHCVVRVDNKLPSMVRLGKIDRVGDLDGVTAQDIPVVESISHPDYHHLSKRNDIALLRLARDAKFDDNVKAVCLNTKPETGSRFIVLGWGVTNTETGERSRFLRKLFLEPYDLNKCNQTFFESPSQTAIYDTQFCASLNAPGLGPCQGDGGGPILIQNTKDDKVTPDIVVGITSWGRGCRSAIPTVFTRVSSYIDWIEGIVWP